MCSGFFFWRSAICSLHTSFCNNLPMTRILLGLAGVVLLAVVALGFIWLAGQLLLGVGALAVGTAGVLLRLLWFFVVAGVLGGAAYFVANAWRPGWRGAAQATTRPARVAARGEVEAVQTIVATVDPQAQKPEHS